MQHHIQDDNILQTTAKMQADSRNFGYELDNAELTRCQ
jgi:hypothetical protein